MKATKDTNREATDIIGNAEGRQAAPATTSGMIADYRRHLQLNHAETALLVMGRFAIIGPTLKADMEGDPFIIQFSNPLRPTGVVAYLVLRGETVEWRYHRSPTRYERCPIVRDPVVMQWLDGLFAAFYLQAELPSSLDGALEMLGPWDRVHWVRTNLFEGGRPEETLTDEIDMWVYDLNFTAPLKQFLYWVSNGLDKDKKHFRYTACSQGEGAEFYFLQYGKREAMAFPDGQPKPLRYLAGVVNSILQPDYELRRFRDNKLEKDGILMPLAPKDWEALTTAYGPMAIEARFSPIHRHIKTVKKGGVP